MVSQSSSRESIVTITVLQAVIVIALPVAAAAELQYFDLLCCYHRIFDALLTATYLLAAYDGGHGMRISVLVAGRSSVQRKQVLLLPAR
eukprot:scaffold4253_cov105-Skeletonema_dohrnii-CCMP3373.AAC.4